MTENMQLICPKCKGSLTKARCLATHDRLALRYAEVCIIVGTKRLALATYFCEVCGAVMLYAEPEPQLKPNTRKNREVT